MTGSDVYRGEVFTGGLHSRCRVTVWHMSHIFNGTYLTQKDKEPQFSIRWSTTFHWKAENHLHATGNRKLIVKSRIIVGATRSTSALVGRHDGTSTLRRTYRDWPRASRLFLPPRVLVCAIDRRRACTERSPARCHRLAVKTRNMMQHRSILAKKSIMSVTYSSTIINPAETS